MRQDAVGIAKQVGAGAGGLGTENTVMAYWLPTMTAERGPNIEDMEVDETLGHPFPSDLERGIRFFEPKITGKARGASLPLLLMPFLGPPTTTTPDVGAAPTARNHAFDVVANLTPTAVTLAILNRLATYGVGTADLYTLFWDALGQELTMSVELNEWIGFEAGFVARKYDDAQALPAPAADASRRFPFYETKAYASINGAGEVEIPVEKFEFTFGANVPTDVGVLGSQELYRIRPGNRDLSVAFTPRTAVDDWYKRAVALGDQDNCKLRLEALGPTIGGAVKHKVELTIANAQVQEAPIDVDAGETIEGVEISARCAYDPGTSKFLSANIVNTVAAY